MNISFLHISLDDVRSEFSLSERLTSGDYRLSLESFKQAAERTGGEAPPRLGELAESMLQLCVNTMSFVRVGAFALAHAGLSAAIMGMADATGGIEG